MKHLTLKINGKVQGVFFRKSAKEFADNLEISGWARNKDDGSILVEAEGKEVKLREFSEWARRGPQGAVVDKVEEKWSKKIVGYNDFQVIW